MLFKHFRCVRSVDSLKQIEISFFLIMLTLKSVSEHRCQSIMKYIVYLMCWKGKVDAALSLLWIRVKMVHYHLGWHGKILYTFYIIFMAHVTHVSPMWIKVLQMVIWHEHHIISMLLMLLVCFSYVNSSINSQLIWYDSHNYASQWHYATLQLD